MRALGENLKSGHAVKQVQAALFGGVALWQSIAMAQGNPYEITLRNRTITPDAKSIMNTTPEGHAMVQFNEGGLEAGVDAIVAAGGSVVTKIDANTLLANFPEGGTTPEIDGARWVEMLEPDDKLSVFLGQKDDSQFALVHLHSDVSRVEGETKLGEIGLEVIPNEDLLETTILVSGSIDQLNDAAELDETSWIEPAPEMVVNGEPFHQCPGASTEFGPEAKFNANGDGWDGAGLGAASLGYNTDNLTADQANRLEEALGQWASVAQLDFTKAVFDSTRSLDVFWQTFDSGFFDSHNVYAVGFFPFSSETIAGDIIFNATDFPNLASNDFYSIALHEVGHALGLNHSDAEGAVMAAFYTQGNFHTNLTPDDIEGIRSIYQEKGGVAPGDVPPGGDIPPGCGSNGNSTRPVGYVLDYAVLLTIGAALMMRKKMRSR